MFFTVIYRELFRLLESLRFITAVAASNRARFSSGAQCIESIGEVSQNLETFES